MSEPRQKITNHTDITKTNLSARKSLPAFDMLGVKL